MVTAVLYSTTLDTVTLLDVNSPGASPLTASLSFVPAVPDTSPVVRRERAIDSRVTRTLSPFPPHSQPYATIRTISDVPAVAQARTSLNISGPTRRHFGRTCKTGQAGSTTPGECADSKQRGPDAVSGPLISCDMDGLGRLWAVRGWPTTTNNDQPQGPGRRSDLCQAPATDARYASVFSGS